MAVALAVIAIITTLESITLCNLLCKLILGCEISRWELLVYLHDGTTVSAKCLYTVNSWKRLHKEVNS